MQADETRDAIEWRIQTLEHLIKISPTPEEYVINHAKAFLSEYRFLLKPDLTSNSEKDLAEIISEFIKKAILLWSMRSIADIIEFSEMPSQNFDKNNTLVLDAGGVCLRGCHHEIHGRPLAVLVQSLVMATSYNPSGEEMEPVCWSRARIWISEKNE